LAGLQRLRGAPLAPQRRRGFVGGALQLGRLEAVDVGEVGGAAVDDANARPLLGARLDRLDPGLVDRHRLAAPAFGEDLGKAAAVGESPREHPLGDGLVEQLAHPFSLLPATSIRRPAATNSSAPLRESWAWSALRPCG